MPYKVQQEGVFGSVVCHRDLQIISPLEFDALSFFFLLKSPMFVSSFDLRVAMYIYPLKLHILIIYFTIFVI